MLNEGKRLKWDQVKSKWLDVGRAEYQKVDHRQNNKDGCGYDQ